MFDRLLRNVVIGFMLLLVLMSIVALWKEKQVPDAVENMLQIPYRYIPIECEPGTESPSSLEDNVSFENTCNYREACKIMGYCEEFCYLHYCQEDDYYRNRLYETQILLDECKVLIPIKSEKQST